MQSKKSVCFARQPSARLGSYKKRDEQVMDDEIIYCDECELEAVYKANGLFLCTVCLTKNNKEVKNEL